MLPLLATPRRADELVMDRLAVAVSHGQLVDAPRTIAALRTELRRADETLHSLRGKEQAEVSRAQANEAALHRQERTLGQRVAALQHELAEQRHAAAVAAAAARDAALRQAQALRREASANAAQESRRHAAEMAALRAELGAVREAQAAHADGQATGEHTLQQLLSELTGTRDDLAAERQRTSLQAQAAMAERTRGATESKAELARERERMLRLAGIAREEERQKMLAQVEAERTEMQAEIAAVREQLAAGERARAERAAEDQAWQRKKNDGMLATIAEYKRQIATLQESSTAQAVAVEQGVRELDTMLELHVQADTAWGEERTVLQQRLAVAEEETAQLKAQLMEGEAQAKVQQDAVETEAAAGSAPLFEAAEAELRAKLSGLRLIALHKRALRVRALHPTALHCAVPLLVLAAATQFLCTQGLMTCSACVGWLYV